MTQGNASVLSAAEACSFFSFFFTVFIFLIIHFNWTLITLKYCNGFCHSLT